LKDHKPCVTLVLDTPRQRFAQVPTAFQCSDDSRLQLVPPAVHFVQLVHDLHELLLRLRRQVTRNFRPVAAEQSHGLAVERLDVLVDTLKLLSQVAGQKP